MSSELKPVHIQLKNGVISDRVLVTGDEMRVREIAGFLSRPKVVNTYRFLVINGIYDGKKVTVASHGMGASSAAIAIEELHSLGADNIIRFGTCGGLLREQERGELLVVSGAAYSTSGVVDAYSEKIDYNASFRMAPKPDDYLTRILINNVGKLGIKYRVGVVFSTDAFYKEKDALRTLKQKKISGMEMECAALFTLANLRGFRSASLLLVVDKPGSGAFMPVRRMHELARISMKSVLDTLTRI